MKQTTAVVLAGGQGKRFWPIGTSKSLISFLGKPLLVHNLERLRKTGIRDVIVVIHPQDQQALASLAVSGLSITTVIQPEANGMAGALLAASALIGSNACFVMNAEDLVDESLYVTLKEHIGGESMILVGKKMTEYFPMGYVVFEGDRVVSIVEKPGAGKEPSAYGTLVFHYFPNPKQYIERLRQTASQNDDVYEKALSELLKQERSHMISYDGYWWPTKYPWHILDIMDQMLLGVSEYRGKNIEIKENVVIEGPVHIGNNVKIFEHTKITGPCYIGDHTIIGNNNIIRHSQIGAHCVTGFNTDITRSYIGDSCWFHSNYIGDSVLEENVSMGSGSVLANLRLDETSISSYVRGEKKDTGRKKLGAIIGAHVRMGVNVSSMPGVKIGSRSFVGAGVTLGVDVPDESFCYTKSQLVVTKNTQSLAGTSRDEFKGKI